MRIIFFIDKIGGGGRERRMAQLVCELNKHDDIKMVAITAHADVEYKELDKTSLKIVVVNEKNHIKRLDAYERIIKQFAPDVIHLWVETPLYCICLPHLAHKYKCKYIVGFVADGNPLPILNIRTLAIRYTFLHADAIVSNSIAGVVAKKVPRQKSIVINNGFGFNRLNVKVDRERKLEELGIKSRFIVSMIARVELAKDWRSFIKVAEKASEDNLNVFFLAVGSGELLSYYQSEVVSRNLHNIKFIGRRSDVEEILKITDISMLFTSEIHKEGISNSIMEAMAAGLPVIATEGGGTPEIINDCVNGYIIPLHDVTKAYQIMKSLLTDESQRHLVGEAARAHIYDNFQLSKMGDEYIDLYQKLLKK